LGEEELGSRLIQCGQAKAYLHAKFHLDSSNRLATIHQRHNQDRQRSDSIWRTVFINGGPKNLISLIPNCSSPEHAEEKPSGVGYRRLTWITAVKTQVARYETVTVAVSGFHEDVVGCR